MSRTTREWSGLDCSRNNPSPGESRCWVPQSGYPLESAMEARRDAPAFHTLRFHFVGEAQADTIKIMVAWQEFLESKPDISGGEICAAGTRIPVTVILESLAEGSSKEEILNSYPSLKPVHIEAALAYAAELAHEERLLPIRGK